MSGQVFLIPFFMWILMSIFTSITNMDNYEKKVAKKYKIIYHAVIYNVLGAERRRLWELEKGEVH